MNLKRTLLNFSLGLFALCLSQMALAGQFGLNLGAGVPYLTQAGLNYVTSSNNFSFEVRYNSLSVEQDLASASVTTPEVHVKWHPFSGSFYLGLGAGQMSLVSEATDETTGQTVEVDVSASTVTPSVGWMWGASNGGFFLGLDAGYQMPQNPDTTITDSLSDDTSEAYQDAEKQAEDLADTSIPVLTILRLGYLW